MAEKINIKEMIDRGDPEWRELVWLMLGETDDSVIHEALDLLAQFGEPEDIPRIKPLLNHKDPSVYGAALHAINQIDAPLSVRLYLDMLKTPRAEELAGRYTFFKGEYDGQEDALFDGLKPLLTKTPCKHFSILELMKAYRPERFPEALERAVDGKVDWLVKEAITELEEQPDPVAIPLYEKLMRRRDAHRNAGYEGLWRRVGPPRDATMIREALKGDDQDLQQRALEEVCRRQGEGVPFEDVLPMARANSPNTRAKALKVIAMYPDQRALTELIVAAVGDRLDLIRKFVARLLDAKSAEYPVVQLLAKDGSPTWESLRDRLCNLIAWGEAEGERLLGVPVTIESYHEGVGQTRLSRKGDPVTIKANLRPAIDGTPYGEDLVRGIILHELGHHLCDYGGRGMKAAQGAARAEGLRTWFNVLIDERMERQLRARRTEWGIYLDRLTAHMFLRRCEDIPLPPFAAYHRLGLEAAASALRTGTLPGEWVEHPAGIDKSLVRIRQGDLLRMPGILAPHQVFLVCLRAGIQPPAGADSRVAQALDLIPANLKDCTHWELVALCRKLAELLGGQDKMAREEEERGWRIMQMLPELLGLLKGLSEVLRQAGLESAGGTAKRDRRTITVKEKPKLNESSSPLGAATRILYDAKEDQFDRLQITQGPDYDANAHRAVVAMIRKHIGPLRSHFVQLCHRTTDEYASRRGHRLDPVQGRASVIRPSVQVLVHERQVDDANLYLGILIDRSGSMEGENLERAKAFAVLLVESARQLPGIEGSIDAFDHKRFIRLGTFRRCSVTGLESSGFNNDAGALYEAARLAVKSGKKNKLLIMISDGSPSGCTFEALQNFVVQLERRHGILCAQVAVEPLEKIAFPHYLDLSQYSYSEAVRRFGQLLVKLTTPWR